tara:strand:- start:1 stop:273 length:273 start_codon:yes stop_codon:yes gene_type:complete
MSEHFTDFQGSINEAVRKAIVEAIPDAVVYVEGGGGHFVISVISKEFEGKRTLAKQRLVYQAIAPLMAGDAAPVHAVDTLQTLTPDEVGE